MAQLIVRKLDDDVVDALKQAAARHGRSAEAEHRQILRDALLNDAAVEAKEVLLAMPDVGSDDDFERIADVARPIEL
jgi:plasmid stability protein